MDDLTALAVTGLAVARGGVTLAEGLSFRVPKGGALVLRGPNGSGKTTLLRTLAGLQPPVAGQIHARDQSLAYAAHADGLKAQLTVAENLAFWAAVYGAPGIAHALAPFALGPLAGRQARDLSAGQKRRLGLARLLLTGRAVWLLDEPTVSLDAGAVAMFGAMLRGHLAAGGAAVVSTHVDLGLPEAAVLDLAAFRARRPPVAATEDWA